MSDSEEQNIFVMERPMHLVKPERQHQGFSCIPEAMKVLKMLHKPVTVVSLVGSQRGGKSSLLNLLYDRNTGLKNGFGVGHEMDAKTHGLSTCAYQIPYKSAFVAIFDKNSMF